MNERHYEILVGNLCALYSAAQPGEIGSDGRYDDWEVFGAAMLARCHYLLESVTALRDRQIDAAVLLRSLYEHVVTFSWIAVDPPVHLERFLVLEAEERRKAINELRNFSAVPPQTGAGFEQFKESYVREGVLAAPSVPERATVADEKWSAFVVEKLGPTYSLRGMYTVYRHTSTFVHPSMSGLQPFIDGDGQALTVGRPLPLEHSPGYLAPILFGFALIVASECFGRPQREQVFDAFERAAKGIHMHATRSQ